MKKVNESSTLPVDTCKAKKVYPSKTLSPLKNSAVISRLEFVELIDKILVPESAKRVIWSVESEGHTHYFPCFIEKKGRTILGWRELRHMPDLYPGRSEAAVQIGSDFQSKNLLAAAFGGAHRWDCFSFRVLAGSLMEQQLLTYARQFGCLPFLDSEVFYPYIDLPDNWDDLYGSYQKKFRYNLRNCEKQLNEMGVLTLESVVTQDKVDQFLENVLKIERESWKEKAGTSLTTNDIQKTFHVLLAPKAIASGIFRGYVLKLDSIPIAYVYGLYSNHVFHSLKLSFSEQFRLYAPGTVITKKAVQDLIEIGASVWDFAGPSEPYKLRWTKDEYCLRSYTVMSSSWRGRLLGARRRSNKLVRPSQAR